MLLRALVAFTIFALSLPAFAQQIIAAESDEAVASDEARQALTAQASEYELRVDGKPCEFRQQPLLSWSNPARRGEDGLVFLWSLDEKPVAIGTCFTYVYDGQTRRKHAFAALSNEPVTNQHRGRMVWQPNKDALKFHSLGNNPVVGSTAAQRTTQLRQLARRFQVTLTLKDGRTEQCRLVPQPLHRFDADGNTGQCGAIFSFAVGTDPETLLMIQRRLDPTGTPAWHYAFVRFTYYPLEGFLDGESIWNPDELENMIQNILTRPDYQRETYVTFRPDWLD